MIFYSNRHPDLVSRLSMIPRVKPEGMPFRKPVLTPDQVRGRLFRDHALAQRDLSDLILVFLLGIGAEDHLDASNNARGILPYFSALGVEPQQG
jgi:hypothetical protein